MNTRLIERAICTLAMALMLEAVAVAEDASVPFSPMEIKRILAESASKVLIPELDSGSPSELSKTAPAKRIREWAEAEPRAIPLTTYTLYRKFRSTGERTPYERPYFDKRADLTRAVLAAWIFGKADCLDRANDLIWNICEETTWVIPAHERDGVPWNIDLFAAETAAELAHALFLLGDRLPEEIRQRLHDEVGRRIFDPYLAHARDYWWNEGRNNWTGVCAGAIGQTLLILEADPERQAAGIALVLEQLGRFIQNGFEDDGGCLEGVGYWNYGLLHYVSFAEMLRVRSAGAIDLLANAKMAAIARFPLAAAIGKGAFASFSDSSEHCAIYPFIGARLAERTSVPELKDLIAPDYSGWGLTANLRNMLWWKGATGAQPELRDTFLPASGIGKLVGKSSGRTLVLIAKAGHNAEPHNHNDVGSFILRVGETTYLADPGSGLYNKDYFGPKRYENIFANSYGHSVPRIGSALQKPGAEHRGGIRRLADNSLQITFHEAYDLPELRSLTRTFTLQDNGVVLLQDEFLFDGPGLAVEEAFVTWLDTRIKDGKVLIQSEDGVLKIESDMGGFTAERLEDACKANNKSGVLTRISATSPAGRSSNLRFMMRCVPAR